MSNFNVVIHIGDRWSGHNEDDIIRIPCSTEQKGHGVIEKVVDDIKSGKFSPDGFDMMQGDSIWVSLTDQSGRVIRGGLNPDGHVQFGLDLPY